MTEVIESVKELVDYFKSIEMYLKDNSTCLEDIDYRRIVSMRQSLEASI